MLYYAYEAHSGSLVRRDRQRPGALFSAVQYNLNEKTKDLLAVIVFDDEYLEVP